MLDYLITLALILLVVGHGFLIKGCFKINDAIPESVGQFRHELSNDFQAVSGYLSDVVVLLDELAGGLPQTAQQTPQNPIESILTGLISNIGMGEAYASEKQEREIYEVNEEKKPTEVNEFA